MGMHENPIKILPDFFSLGCSNLQEGGIIEPEGKGKTELNSKTTKL